MLPLARYLPPLLLLGVAFAAGSASALAPPGEVCRTVMLYSEGRPSPFFVLYAVHDEMIALDQEVHALVPQQAPVGPLPLGTAGAADVCVYWLNVCGPPLAVVFSKL